MERNKKLMELVSKFAFEVVSKAEDEKEMMAAAVTPLAMVITMMDERNRESQFRFVYKLLREGVIDYELQRNAFGTNGNKGSFEDLA